MIITEGRLEVRWFGTEYLDQLVDLHRACLYHEEWTRRDFHRYVGKGSQNVVKVLVDERDTVYGSMLYTMPLTGDFCRLRRVCVWPDYRRRGLGTFLVHTLTGARSPVRGKLFTARVHEKYGAMHCLLRRLGWSFDPDAPRELAEDGLDYYLFSYRKPEPARVARRP